MAVGKSVFDKELHADAILDEQSIVRALLATQQPRIMITGTTSRETAVNFLRAHGLALGIEARQLTARGLRRQADFSDRGVEYRFLREKQHSDLTTVVFQQTYLELPIWQAGISVHVKQERPAPNWLLRFFYWARYYVSFGRIEAPAIFQVIGVLSTRHDKVVIADLQPRAEGQAQLKAAILKTLDSRTLVQQLGIAQDGSVYDGGSLSITHQRLMIYRYRAADRDHGLVAPSDAKSKPAYSLAMPLPPVPSTITEGSHIVVAAVYFNLKRKDRNALHWVALVEVKTLSILYLEAFTGGIRGFESTGSGNLSVPSTVMGQVFMADPMTTNNGPTPDAPEAELNHRRVSAVLPNLKRSSPQRLTGRNVKIENFDDPSQPPQDYEPPTRPAGTSFDYAACKNQFAAVNAYFHCDRFFNLVEELGFNRDSYFPGTSFPLKVDHRGTPTREDDGNCVDAECRALPSMDPNGNDVILGTDQVVFALAWPFSDPPIGIANDWRVVLHELGGHATLQNHVHSSNFKFAHSAGDSFAAILNDPESKASDRGATFPWVVDNIDRRHDRKVADGWGWGGPKDLGDSREQFNREEILASTHFRLYQSLGGGNTAPHAVDIRRDAATYTAYLILRAIMALDGAVAANDAAQWMFILCTANAADWPVKGYAGGAYDKVIRWVFEQQGLDASSLPLVDIYIDDGRHGQYQYKANYQSCPAIWNRLANDGHEGHQIPAPNVVNYAYVKIKNRGSETATSVLVNAFQNTSQTSRNFPNDWTAMRTPRRLASDVLPRSAEVKVGPFEWIPSAGNNFILMSVSADGDPSNLGRFAAPKSIPDWRLVPHDNNLGMRKV